MGDSALGDFARERVGYVILSDNFFESLRPILAIQRLILHTPMVVQMYDGKSSSTNPDPLSFR